MNDYDLPLLQNDLVDLEKRGYVKKDELDCKFVDYAGVLAQVRPKATAMAGQPAMLARAVVRLQSAWRGRKARRRVEELRRQQDAELAEVADALDAL
jgi:hypothetical protein